MKLSKRGKIAAMTVALLVAGFAAWFQFRPSEDDDESDFGQRPEIRSTDLNADRKLMWATEDQRSTDEAIRAAERVFATVELLGLTRDEVVAILGDPRTSSDSRYNIPFYPAGSRDLVYRFDNGVWGCQYNVKFGRNGKVRLLQFRGIE